MLQYQKKFISPKLKENSFWLFLRKIQAKNLLMCNFIFCVSKEKLRSGNFWKNLWYFLVFFNISPLCSLRSSRENFSWLQLSDTICSAYLMKFLMLYAYFWRRNKAKTIVSAEFYSCSWRTPMLLIECLKKTLWNFSNSTW